MFEIYYIYYNGPEFNKISNSKIQIKFTHYLIKLKQTQYFNFYKINKLYTIECLILN